MDRDLSTLRKNFKDLYEEESHLLNEMSIQESLQIWIELQNAFESQLQQTAPLFEEERRRHLIELQARLAKLAA